MASRPQPDFAPIALVFAGWGLAVALVGIDGNFPLSDDWAYAHVVRSLLAGRGFDFLPWTGASVVAQTLVAAAACKLAGFSYVTLRATTLVCSAVGIASFYALLREVGGSVRAAAAGAAVLAFSPLWFNLSFTFMTDVPFAAFALVAAWVHALAFRRDSRALHLLAGAAAAAAFLVRQHAVWITAAAVVAALAAPAAGRPVDPATRDEDLRTTRRRAQMPTSGATSGWATRIVDAMAAAVLPVVVVAAYTWWTLTSASAPLAAHNKIGEALAASLLSIGGATFRGLGTLGFLFLPWAFTLRFEGRGERRAFAVVVVVLASLALLLFAREGASMFYLTNMLADFTVGPLTTRDTQFLALGRPPSGSAAFHAALTAASLASAAALVTRIAMAAPAVLRRDDARVGLFCSLAFVLSALGSLVQAHYYFDRYLIVILPLAIAAVASVSPPPRVGAGLAAALIVIAFYSVAGTHDYMAWNRARWQLLGALEHDGVTARQIDGGVEYNAERLAAELRTSPTDAQARRGQTSATRSWWWVVDDEWLIAFGAVEGYASVNSLAYSRWLPPGEGRVYMLHRRTFGNRAEPDSAPVVN